MKEIYYIGFYNCIGGKKREKSSYNLPGTMKMDFIIKVLKKLGYRVKVVSLSIDDTVGFHPLEKVVIDDLEEHYYLSYFSFKLRGKVRGAVASLIRSLRTFIKKQITKESCVISYHSLAYGMLLTELQKEIGFRWISQIEELYSLSRKDYQDESYLSSEEKMFNSADGFLFVNDILPSRYAGNKPFAVSYGNYHVFSAMKPKVDSVINVVYTGVINEDRGIFLLMEAVKYLPPTYVLNILGFGSDDNMKRFKEQMDRINQETKEERIHFYGTRSGKEYSAFLANQNIGVSLMGLDSNIAENAFPSKIMAYLGHSLYVVSSKSESITRSKVAKYLYFCDNTPNDVARAIEEVPVHSEYNVSSALMELEDEFVQEVRKVLE